ncbi:phosphotransferase [Lentibacillus sp. Marseille-P4043]|uniref:phosphotransferase n=1 Tax=Lentibacillus sp. Marseille-P4043 TaxID=2040293 RepID=UPI000D0BBB97|nr:phosphotransferase [Lentibacillus sp. Marseille-P4043]
MNNFKRRDEMQVDRLSSFLYQKGKLECAKIIPIKAYVFHVTTHQGVEKIVKKHRNFRVIEQQWNFFEEINLSTVNAYERFPNGKKYIKHNQHIWTLAPFIQGRKLNYGIEADRKSCLNTLRQFHEHARSITVPNPVKRQLFYVRWANRLASFKKTAHFFAKNGFETLFKDIVQTSEVSLRYAHQLPWKSLEQNVERDSEWIHGDVAGHNFIRNKEVHMIDFDLLACSPMLHDYIQLGQRFLPYLDWDFDKLLDYRMVKEKQLKLWISAMVVPADVMREWLHFLNRKNSTSVYHYLAGLEKDWIKRQSFLKKAQSMLKSI